MREHAFQHKVRARLKEIEGLWCFSHEALSVRGIPDIIGVYRGHFFAWELKKDLPETRRRTGRIVLQRHVLQLIKKAGGTGEFVCPENFENKLQALLSRR